MVVMSGLWPGFIVLVLFGGVCRNQLKWEAQSKECELL